MKIHKTILALTALIIIFGEAGSQKILLPPPPPPSTTSKTFFPPIPSPPVSPSPPPPPVSPPPPPPVSPSPPPPPPPVSPSPPPSSPSPPPPPISPSPSPSPPPSSSPSSSVPPSSSPSTSSSAPSSPSPSPSGSQDTPQLSCSVSCSDSKLYCDIPSGTCRPKGGVGDNCNNDNECLGPFVCHENACGYSDVPADGKKDDEHYNIKKVAVVGAVIVGVAGICALIFFVIRYLKKKRDYDIASRLYSTDDDMSETDPYPFAERSNSFSQSTVQQPPHVPTTNRYDNVPPTGNRGYVVPRPGYHNYYNKYNNEGLYMRQNRQNEEGATRTMNLLQQTRGNVMITPQQNYNWNQPAMRVNQGGLFPIPSVNGNHVVPPPNNTNTDNMDNMRNFNNMNSPGEDDDSKHDHPVKTSYSVDYTNFDHNNHQTNKLNKHHTRKDSNTLSDDDVKFETELNLDNKKKEAQSNPDIFSAPALKPLSERTYSESILDSYAQESIFAKTLEAKLAKSSAKYNNNNNNMDDLNPSTIQQNISRTQTFGNGYDPTSQLPESRIVKKKITE